MVPVGFSNYNSMNNFYTPMSSALSGASPAASDVSGISGAKNASVTGKAGIKASPTECQTCKERKYQDGSNENVSFKTPTHISPNAAASAVQAHEGEHVSNAYTKAAEKNGKVLSASVAIHTAICPECGRTYVSGGTTSTMIQYRNDSNPYQQNKKAQDALRFTGANIDYVA
ncbi:MAG: hypothetical protein PUB98_05440 [Clostridiales bacterium]|nr:hypothetical protein [Clostridiales bacterium]